ncbi:MAG: radical SAM protein [Candidatus Omnitrophica bacterium CG11_big_fil_rev_8_21_14_0_20_42_13]|uniref:Radical SAM protein n=1 Tax=Candidatus Ghiorseimicrobium undicola TaxID=1974746 RepID=A0A2H0LYT8_9BACT|nr:MAG: radical SAM protein [Candidatus Omnitrophica bacterium CG11_big_fil_rev_8_21_14_0_20_42_13]
MKEYPSYRNLYKTGELEKRAAKAMKIMESCSLCPKKCSVKRLENEKGACKTGKKSVVSSYFLHQGEEPPISGTRGSGTIFFTHCNLSCLYCQNYKLSQQGEGREVEDSELAEFMLELQKAGAHNINLVSPTHVLANILNALVIAAGDGLKIPIVYNTSGYELPQALKLLDGVVDIYLADMRYGEDDTAAAYSNARQYVFFNQSAVKEMLRQTKEAIINRDGIIERGLIIRHLVLPNKIAETEKILSFIKNELSAQCHISLMSQYFPSYRAGEFPELNRRITREEYQKAKDVMVKLGLSRGWIQEAGGLERFAGLNIKPNV